MTEPVIAAVAAALTPEAEALLNELHDFAAAELAKLEAEAPQLLTELEAKVPGVLDAAGDEAKNVANAGLVRLRNVVERIETHLGLRDATDGSGVDPTPAAPAPQPIPS